MEAALLIGDSFPGDEEVGQLLERCDWKVLTASHWEAGREILGREQPALVMLEHPLKDADALEVLKTLPKHNPNGKVIVVTAQGEMEVAIEALRAGAIDYLRRPIDPEQLQIAVGRARERRRRHENHEPPTILVLEDHEPTRRRVIKVLEKEGYRVEAAADGEAGMTLFRERRFDLILADVRMPVKDGIRVLRETKGRGADVEVIVVTGYGDEEIVVEALREGAINFLKKPVDIDQMLLAIEKALEHQRTRRSLAYRNRDVEIMQELVVRLTKELELVVETPAALSPGAIRFLHSLVDALPFGVAVIDGEKQLVFANRHITDKTSTPPRTLATEWLSAVGIDGLPSEELEAAFQRATRAQPGSVETVSLSRWAFLVLTPLTLISAGNAERYVALAIRGERNRPASQN